jgi:hypothetical protein
VNGREKENLERIEGLCLLERDCFGIGLGGFVRKGIDLWMNHLSSNMLLFLEAVVFALIYLFID